MMQLKVIYLINHLDKIERDSEEIENLQHNLQKDRSYSTQVQETLKIQAKNLSLLKEKILSQVIKNPPSYLKEVDSAQTEQLKPYQTKKETSQNSPSWPENPVVHIPNQSGQKKASTHSATQRYRQQKEIPQASPVEEKEEPALNKKARKAKRSDLDQSDSSSFPFTFKGN